VDARLDRPGIYSLLSAACPTWPTSGTRAARASWTRTERYVTPRRGADPLHHPTKGGAPASGPGARTLVVAVARSGSVKAPSSRGSREKGATLLVIEAMKMQNEFRAGASGYDRRGCRRARQAVNGGDVLIVIR